MYIDLDEEREAETKSCFSCDVYFHYLKLIEQFIDLLEVFRMRSGIAKKYDTFSSGNEFLNDSDGFGEKTTCDQLIVMDNVSELADESKKFASFLTVGKFNYICVYIFQIIYPEKSIWRTILSQINMFNIFLASVSLDHVRRTLESVCIRKTKKNIFHNQRSGLANSLLNWPIGVCSDINKDEPGRIIDCYTYTLFNLNLFFF